ncbi:hypothetical protein E8E13_007045 [Curvularia kusanoi]|uniref:Uncharacterized protein n=1 Tax=Curvularia kusanoi TaxID=90978 RepID=A0A9P4T8C9_CURKU|nr:hypothetical protein E8E13_007045 [Curvularia kusanoi]
MTALPATQAEATPLTKPHDWGICLVTAALKCTTDGKLGSTYLTADEAKHGILNALNYLEAHDEYEWPEFTGYVFSFDQVMRLRRVLVGNVCMALGRAGHIKFGVPGTPDSSDGARRDRALNGSPQNLLLNKREAEVDEDALSEYSDAFHEDYLYGVLRDLAQRAEVDIQSHVKKSCTVLELVNILHDGLVKHWDGPFQDEPELSETLKEMAEVWDQHKKSKPPQSSQRERVSTPRTSPDVPLTSPAVATKQVPKGTSVPATNRTLG